jgi:hypothetical protein
MQIEIFTLCQSAVVSGSSLSLVGAFDTIHGADLPVSFNCFVVTKIRFDFGEEGDHKLEIALFDSDMRAVTTGEKQVKKSVNIGIKIPNGRMSSHIDMWNIQGLPMEKVGDYLFELRIDGQKKSNVQFHVELKPK